MYLFCYMQFLVAQIQGLNKKEPNMSNYDVITVCLPLLCMTETVIIMKRVSLVINISFE